MIYTIGETAGAVYNILENKGEMAASKLKTETGVDVFVLNAAIGWLAREDKINVTKKGTAVRVSLKK